MCLLRKVLHSFDRWLFCPFRAPAFPKKAGALNDKVLRRYCTALTEFNSEGVI